MKALKLLALVGVVAMGLFVVAINFSAVESRLSCSGTKSYNGEEMPATIFVKLEKYRWWVGFWSNSKGSLWVEVPNQTVAYFSHVSGSGDVLQIWDTPGKFSGNYSELSRTLGINLDGYGVFEGSCETIGG